MKVNDHFAQPPFAVDDASTLLPAGFWAALNDLLQAGRRHDAEVTLRHAVALWNLPELRFALGSLHFENGAWQSAVIEWTEVIDSAGRLGRTELLTAVYHNLAGLYRQLGNYRLASQFQRAALHYQAECTAEDLLALANDALADGAVAVAEGLLHAAASTLEADDESALAADLQAACGVAAGFRGQVLAGRQALWSAYRTHSRLGETLCCGMDLINLAALAEQSEAWVTAERCLGRAMELLDAHPNPVDPAVRLERTRAEVLSRRLLRQRKLAAFDPRSN